MSAKNTKKWFGCWFYREKIDKEPTIILSLHKKHDDIDEFPYYDIPLELFFIFDFSRVMFIPVISQRSDYPDFDTDIIEYKKNHTGYFFMFGGKITGEIPEYWVGDDIKVLTKDLSSMEEVDCGVLRTDLMKFCEILDDD